MGTKMSTNKTPAQTGGVDKGKGWEEKREGKKPLGRREPNRSTEGLKDERGVREVWASGK